MGRVQNQHLQTSKETYGSTQKGCTEMEMTKWQNDEVKAAVSAKKNK